MTEVQQRSQLDLIAKLNARDAERNPQERELAARIQSFELAYRMQSAAPEALAVENEPAHMQELYGLHSERCGHVARQCIIARRLLERGVRFVQIYSGGMENERSWDGHIDIRGNHSQFAGETDQALRGAADGPQAAWAARGHAGDLVGRVRTPASVAGRHVEAGPGPQPPLLHRLAGGRRDQGRSVVR